MQKQSAIIKEIMPVNWTACKDGTLEELGIANKTDPVSGELIFLRVSGKRHEMIMTLAVRGDGKWSIRDWGQHEALGGNYDDGLLAVVEGSDPKVAVTKFIEILESNNL